MSPVIFGMLIFGMFYAWLCNSDSNQDGIEYFEAGQYDRAMKSFNNYLMLNPHDTKTLYNRGRCHEILGMTEEAIEDYYNVIDRDPGNISALISCTQALYKMERYESAVCVGEMAVLIDENNYLAQYYNARANHKYGDLVKALKGYNAAIDLNPDFGLAYFQRGSLMLTIGYPPFACYDLKVATNLQVEGASEALELYCKK
jgi:tetratricopeptide (TPR) repeat protein